MAKKKDNLQEEHLPIQTPPTFKEPVSTEVPCVTCNKSEEEKERIADFIKTYKERGWDDNRIAARLMISIKQVNEA